MVNLYEHLVGAKGVPDSATCFVTNTTTHISFHDFPPLDENRLILGISWIAVAVLTVVLIVPTRKLMHSLLEKVREKAG